MFYSQALHLQRTERSGDRTVRPPGLRVCELVGVGGVRGESQFGNPSIGHCAGTSTTAGFGAAGDMPENIE